MLKRIIAGALVVTLLTIGAGAGSPSGTLETLEDVTRGVDHLVKGQLSRFDGLEQLAPRLLLAGGAKEQDGIFITPGYLLENITPNDPAILQANLAGIERFLDTHNMRAIVMLIPTACAIKQQEIPARAQLYNQKALISDVYTRLAGKATTIDVYTDLFAAKDQYTYYRTASNLTGLGGYYVYAALVSRLGLSARTLDQFEVEHLPQDYYGNLYERSSYKGIAPDIITLYHFRRFDRRYKLTHTLENGERKSYYTLFPRHLALLETERNVILGGFSPRMDIEVSSPYAESLLIFGDRTALSYLPFLAVHFGKITLFDLERATPELLATLDPEQYDQVMFAYGTDGLLCRPVAAAAGDVAS